MGSYCPHYLPSGLKYDWRCFIYGYLVYLYQESWMDEMLVELKWLSIGIILLPFYLPKPSKMWLEMLHSWIMCLLILYELQGIKFKFKDEIVTRWSIEWSFRVVHIIITLELLICCCIFLFSRWINDREEKYYQYLSGK